MKEDVADVPLEDLVEDAAIPQKFANAPVLCGRLIERQAEHAHVPHVDDDASTVANLVVGEFGKGVEKRSERGFAMRVGAIEPARPPVRGVRVALGVGVVAAFTL